MFVDCGPESIPPEDPVEVAEVEVFTIFCVTISEGFVSDGVDLIITIATPAVQAAATVTNEIPIVFSAVTEPEYARVVESWDVPNTNVTGVSAYPAVTPVQLPTKIFYAINPAAAEIIGIELPKTLVDRAELIYE